MIPIFFLLSFTITIFNMCSLCMSIIVTSKYFYVSYFITCWKDNLKYCMRFFFLNLHWLKRLVYKLPYKSINMPPVFFILLHFHMDNQNKVNGVCFICILYCTLSHLYTQKHNDIHKLTRIMQRKKHFLLYFAFLHRR